MKGYDDITQTIFKTLLKEYWWLIFHHLNDSKAK
jgi:hypothetical protein